MTKVWIYTVASSKDPNRVECAVPWPVDEDLIFFGPCKVRIREQLRRQYLSPDCSYRKATDDLFIVGINGSNKEQIRKVIWDGKLSEVMTFAEAGKRLRGNRFRELREDPRSPFHVSPVMKNGAFVGYDHVSDYHIDDNEWVADLVSNPVRRNIQPRGRRLLIPNGWTHWEFFDRDCCMLLENRFFAQGQGMEIDKEALKILKEAQPEKKAEINDYAVFGLASNGHADGLTGRYLEIKDGELAKRLVAWLEDRSHNAVRHLQGDETGSAKKSCTLHPSERHRRTVCCA